MKFQDSTLKLKTSSGLIVKQRCSSDTLSRELSILLPEIKPNSSFHIPLCLYAQLPLTKESHPIEHSVSNFILLNRKIVKSNNDAIFNFLKSKFELKVSKVNF